MRQSKHNSRRLALVLLALTLCFIWGNSLMPAEVSGAFSDWVKGLLRQLLHLPQGAESEGGTLIRKLAHWSEFFLLGLELAYLVRPVSAALLGGLSAALADETIQLFIPGRAGQVRDVWIDFFGFCVGLAVLLLVQRQRGRRKENPK